MKEGIVDCELGAYKAAPSIASRTTTTAASHGQHEALGFLARSLETSSLSEPALTT